MTLQRETWVVAVSVVAAFVAFLDITVVNVAFPSIAADFPEASLGELSWVLNGYTIAFAGLLLMIGGAADRLGRRRVFLGCLTVFGVASVGCAAASSAETLIVARVIQGAGAAGMVPAGLAMILSEFSADRWPRLIGGWAAAGAIASAIGPPLGGLLVTAGSWRWIFILNAPIAVGGILLGLRFLRESREPPSARRPDPVALSLITTAATAVTLGIVRGPDWGWDDLRVLGCFFLAILAIAATRWRARRRPSGLLGAEVWRAPAFRVANACTFVFGAAFFGLLLCSILFLASIWDYSTLESGLAVSPGPLSAAVAAGASGRLADQAQPRLLVVVGSILFSVGAAWLIVVPGTEPSFVSDWLPGYVIAGAGIGTTFPTLATLVAMPLPARRFATGVAVNLTARQIGGAVGVAAIIAIAGPELLLDDLRAGFLFSVLGGLATAAMAFLLPGAAQSDTSQSLPATAAGR